ncbi:FxSxx-COOH system tetratricopeptide repeat protein [Actinomadura yumaensis]|uniref:FxSxx-COOH system tetratricopeptide repeat protein n=1 Tax=Actinomadura yumaensis TaxID=111807 RepID=A0ABW2CRJ6_9ACTN
MTSPHSGAPRSAGRVPEVWGRIPPRNKNFTGREELLSRLRAGIAGQVTAVVPHALHGLGGVGKTQMAVEYAYRFRAEYEVVWWIPADQPVLVRSSLASLAPHLGLPPSTASGIEDAAKAVLDALRRGEPFSRWLLIFDNADQPEDLNDVIPQGPGHVLITSRNHRWDGVVDTVPVDVFSRAESVEFLSKRVSKAISEQDADRLADELGDLPLALEQAGALQAETGMSVPEYLGLLKERTSQLLGEGKPTEYPVSMTAAWGLSVTSLKERLPEAVELLRCCAFFGPEPIPRDAFSQPRAGIGAELSGLIADPIGLSRAIGELGRYALARLDIPGRTIQVHRLIQALLRDELLPAEQARMRHAVHLLLAGYAPSDPRDPANWPRYANLLGHIAPAAVGESGAPEARTLSLNIVRYLFARGDYASARGLVDGFLKNWIADSGEDHIDVLSLRLEQVNILRELGAYEEASRLNRKSLEVAEKTFGPDDELTLRYRRGDCADLRAKGDFQQARERDEELLRRYEGKYGPTDLDTLRTVNNLALDYGLSSDYIGSKELLQRAFRGWQAAEGAGADKVSLLIAWSGLARAVRLCGDYAEACDLGEDAYAYAKDELGVEHNATLRTGKDLSIAWRRAGDFDRALELAQEVHAKYVRLFGLDHPDTLATAMCLANVQRGLGESDAAMQLAEDTARRYPRVYGTAHPYNYGCRGNLAIMHRERGDAPTARELNEEALTGLEAKLGRDHHYSLTVATNLASDLSALGEVDAACRLGQGTLRRLRAIVGDDHPMALSCAANLAADLKEAGAEEEAAALHERVKDGYARTLGLEHPDAQVFLSGRHLDADFDPPPI